MKKQRYIVIKTLSSYPPLRYQIIDTDGNTLGDRFVGASDNQFKANQIANALNFNDKPHAYGYKLVD